MVRGRNKEREKFKIISHFNEVTKNYVKYRKAEGEKYFFADLYDDLANFTGLSISSFIVMRKDNYTPSLVHAIKISEFFNIPITQIWESVENTSYINNNTTICKANGCNHFVFASCLCVNHYSNRNQIDTTI